jgi:hypothetical protein
MGTGFYKVLQKEQTLKLELCKHNPEVSIFFCSKWSKLFLPPESPPTIE